MKNKDVDCWIEDNKLFVKLVKEFNLEGSLYLKGTQIKKGSVPKHLRKQCKW